MSFELAVILSRLTDRLLVLRGNATPTANVVKYDGVVRNSYPSKISDLIDLGVPWINAENINLSGFAPHELCPHPAWDCVFYFPDWLAIDTEDIRAFAGRRELFVTAAQDLANVPALSLSGGEHNTLSFYSYFFYLDGSAQSQAVDALRNMRPKTAYAAFARRVAKDLGDFNAVHIRRGDFKKTKGVTTLVRTPEEVITGLDQQFGREDRLVILTDEADDPFFEPVKAAFKDHLFLDRHVLADYGRDFLDLPAHDSISLAYISQLIASQSQDFIGSMHSTFTALIQRMRGNSGLEENFKFLWNELPTEGAVIEPGSHPIADEIRLEKGIMVPEREGPYSWNRFNRRLNPAWMREWPESFSLGREMVERARTRPAVRAASTPAPLPTLAKSRGKPSTSSRDDELEFIVSFLGHCIIAGSNRPDFALAMRNLFAMMVLPYQPQSSGEVRVEAIGEQIELLVNGRAMSEMPLGSSFLRRFYRQVVTLFIDVHPQLTWLHAGAVAANDRAIILPGEWARGKSSLVIELYHRGWSFLSDDIVPLDPSAATVMPFPSTPQIRFNVDKNLRREDMGSVAKSALALDPAKLAKGPQRPAMIVFPYFGVGATAKLIPISAGQAVGKLLQNCLSFVKNDDAIIRRLCAVVENLPTYDLHFGNAAEGACLLIQTYDLLALPRGFAAP